MGICQSCQKAIDTMVSLTYRDPFPLALHAFPTAETAGRRYPEPPHPYRGAFQRDRDRIIHCAAFRRLSEKMQVFTAEFGNYHRTRLTHTMEVVGVARTIGRALQLNEDLIEAAALLHDIGHSPFGHAGETVLDRLLLDCGGFEHNAQALRIVEKLERRYSGFPGLNLSKEVLEGQAYKVTKTVVPLLEIQVVDIADSIAYDTHDVDDAMELGLLTTEQLVRTSLWKRSAHRVRQQWTNLSDGEFRRAVVHDLIETQVSDVLQATSQRLNRSLSQRERTGVRGEEPGKDSHPYPTPHPNPLPKGEGTVKNPNPLPKGEGTVKNPHPLSKGEGIIKNPQPEGERGGEEEGGGTVKPLIAPSPEIAEQKREMEQFLMDNVYRHPNVMVHRRRVAGWIETIFDYYATQPERLPERYGSVIQQEGARRAAADYVADQTDRSIRSELLKLNPRRVG